MLIILPDHLRVSGITTWAIHAVRGLRARCIPAGLLVHTRVGEHVPGFLEPYVVGRIENATCIHRLHGCLDELIPTYLATLERMQVETGQPVLVSPNLHGDCYGAIASIAQHRPELVRVASWIHSDNEYDIGVAKRYEPMLHAIVPVSSELDAIARRSLPWRTDDILHIPYCVPVEDALPDREARDGRPLRLVYTGRLEEHQKRASSLPMIAQQLHDRGLDFEFRIVGDGPLMDAIVDSCSTIKEVSVVGPVPPDQVGDHLHWADIWVLPSRYEGQSVAMLEALAHGCVPVVTKVRSGAQDAVLDGTTGLRVESEWNTPLAEVASRVSDAILSLRDQDLDAMSCRAHELARRHHSIDTHIDAIEKLMREVRAMTERAWPSEIRASYSAKGSELDGSTPPDAAKRMLHLLNSLEGKRVLLYCSGQHTKDISAAVEASSATVIGILDDDPSKEGQGLIGYPIYASSRIGELGASDVVISSWIYEDSIWERRQEIEAMGVRLHRLYPVEASRTAALAKSRS